MSSAPWPMEFYHTEETDAVMASSTSSQRLSHPSVSSHTHHRSSSTSQRPSRSSVTTQRLPRSSHNYSKSFSGAEIPSFKRASSYVGTQSGFLLWDPDKGEGPDFALDSSTPPPLSAQYTFFDEDALMTELEDAPAEDPQKWQGGKSSLLSPSGLEHPKADTAHLHLFPIDTSLESSSQRRPRSSPRPIPVSPARAATSSSSSSSSSFASFASFDDGSDLESGSLQHTLPDATSLYGSPILGGSNASSFVDDSPIYRSRPGSCAGSLSLDLDPLDSSPIQSSSCSVSSNHLSGTLSSLRLRTDSGERDYQNQGHFSAPTTDTGLLHSSCPQWSSGNTQPPSPLPTSAYRRRSTGSCSSRRSSINYPPPQVSLQEESEDDEKSDSIDEGEDTEEAEKGTDTSKRAATDALHDAQDIDDDVVTCGQYTRAERRLKVERYRAKRERRTFKKQIMYECRKTFADKRPRVGGRFVKVDKTKATTTKATKSAKSTKSSRGKGR